MVKFIKGSFMNKLLIIAFFTLLAFSGCYPTPTVLKENAPKEDPAVVTMQPSAVVGGTTTVKY